MQFDANELNDNSLPVTPQVAFVLHGTSTSNADRMTCHSIHDGELQIGDYVAPEAVISMIEAANAESASNAVELIPENVLVDSADFLIWYVRSDRRPFHFRHAAGKGSHWHGQVRYPALVFIAGKHRRSIRILALPNSKRPTLDTQLYHAPLFNLNERGVLCLGNASLPESLSVSTIPEMESAFFDANGSHPNHNGTLSERALKQHKTLIRYWKHKAKANERVRVSELNPYRTLGDVINDL